MSTIARIEQLRAERGLSIADLCRGIGITTTGYAALRKEPKRRMKVFNVVKAADALDVDPLWLLNGGSDASLADGLALLNSLYERLDQEQRRELIMYAVKLAR